jgi:hypothetical protein
VTVTGVTATSPVLRSTGAIAVSAIVTATFDSATGPTTVQTSCDACNPGNTFCGTGQSTYKSKQVLTTTNTSVANQTTTASASDFNSTGPLTGSGTMTGTLTTPISGTDGNTVVTVTANVAEDVTTTTTVTTNYRDGGGCGGSILNSSSSLPSTNTVTKTGSGSGTGRYVLDINPPTLTLHPVTSQPVVLQGEDKNIHNELIGGSANTAYTLTDTATGPNGAIFTANGSGTFGPGTNGIAPKENDLVGIHIACDAPLGTYTATAVANTVDLGGNAFDPISSADVFGSPGGSASDTFQVDPGQFLEDQTQVVSEFSGDYAPMSCFTSGVSGRKVTTFPGSLHITATVNTTGPCAGFGTISGTKITLTLPPDFKFDTTGASPAAHVFTGPAASGFDFHYPSTLPEVTNLIPKPVPSGQTVTVDLSTLNLGNGPGVIPSSNTIYVRAHAVFSGSSVPADGTTYLFTTSTTSILPGPGSVTVSSTGMLTALAVCVDGN